MQGMKETVGLSFKCPVNLGEMPNCSGGKYCTVCAQKVVDYRKTNVLYLRQVLEANKKESNCGIYRPEQIEGGFTDWREGIGRLYRKAKQNNKWLIASLLDLVAFIASCGRHIAGSPIYGWDSDVYEICDSTSTDSDTAAVKKWTTRKGDPFKYSS